MAAERFTHLSELLTNMTGKKLKRCKNFNYTKNGVLTNPELKSKLETLMWNNWKRQHRLRPTELGKKLYAYTIAASFFCSLFNFHSDQWNGTLWINYGNRCGYDKHVIELIHSSYTYTYIYLCTQSINKTTKWELKDYSFIHIQHQKNVEKKGNNQPGGCLSLRIRKSYQASAHFGVFDV